MAKVLDRVFQHIEKVGGDIGTHKWQRISQHTWKDSNCNTLYLN
jgi:hypothetical protein